MQFNRSADGAMVDLPRKSIDTGAGLERILPILEGTDSIYATDVFAPMVERAQSITGVALRRRGGERCRRCASWLTTAGP